MRIKEMITHQEALDCCKNTPWHHLGKWIENSMENLYTDVRVHGVKERLTYDSP